MFLYLVDANCAAARRLMQTLDPKLPLTEFGAFELKNALRCAAFRKNLTISAAEAAIRSIEPDPNGGFLVPTVCLWQDILQTAESLSQHHPYVIGCRALDVLHVASAAVLGCTDFLTFDQRQARLAQQAGLTTPPERPHSRRKFSSSRLPSSVRMLSGWNCTP